MLLYVDNVRRENENLVKEYDKVLKKFSKNNKISKETIDEDYTFSVIEIDTLDILPQLEKEFEKISPAMDGLIFSECGEGMYRIEIYDGYRE